MRLKKLAVTMCFIFMGLCWHPSVSAMNVDKLVAALQAEVKKSGRSPEGQVFISLLKQVWEIDWAVAPSDVWHATDALDIPYFLAFMDMDVGDEAEEKQLLMNWMNVAFANFGRSSSSGRKDHIIDLLQEMIRLRATVERSLR